MTSMGCLCSLSMMNLNTKLWRRAKTVSCTVAMLPIALLMRLFSPFVLIRVGELRCNIIGHYVFDLEYYLATKELTKAKGRDLFFLSHDHSVNQQWDEMVKRLVPVKKWYRYLFLASFLVPGGKVNRIAFAEGSRDRLGVLHKTKGHFSFTKDEQQLGVGFLRGLGIGPKDQFVCLIIRDSAYKRERSRELVEDKDWSYHDYRNSQIETYYGAIQELIEAGFWVFRMGKHVETPLTYENPRVFDYAASSQQNDFLDIWLMANCRFCVSTCTGLDEVARAFRRPAAYINFLPIRNMVTYSPGVNAPKRLFWIGSGEELTLREHLGASYLSGQRYDDGGVAIRNLTPDEIRHVVREMIQRERGMWVSKPDSINRQRQFWEILQSHPEWDQFHGVVDPEVYISDYFIQKNVNWLR